VANYKYCTEETGLARGFAHYEDHEFSLAEFAECTALAAQYNLIPAREACVTARKALARAVELQGESADSLHGEAFVALIERRWEAMEAAWRRAIELQPAHALALGSFGISLCIRQKPDEGFRLLERAREADPLASFPCMLTAWGLLCSGRPQDALPYAEDALSFEKEDVSALFALGMASVALGRFEEGIAALEHAVAVSHRGSQLLGALGWALATAGRKDEARAILEELRARPADAPTSVTEGWLLGALGEIDAAFELLARAEEEFQGLLYYTGMPGFDPLRTDPRFGALLKRLRLPPAPSGRS
jgi:tetratricopeptide (TPR) repeat protein